MIPSINLLVVFCCTCTCILVTVITVQYRMCIFSLVIIYFCSYDAFDFHKECARMQWHNLNILLDRLAATQEEYG